MLIYLTASAALLESPFRNMILLSGNDSINWRPVESAKCRSTRRGRKSTFGTDFGEIELCEKYLRRYFGVSPRLVPTSAKSNVIGLESSKL